MKITNKQSLKSASSIFILDSDPGALSSLKQLFERAGFSVSAFENPDSLLQKLNEGKPQCIVAEAQFVNKDNDRLVVDTHRKTPDLPIILLAVRSDISAAVRALRTGATDYFEKPIVDRLLIESVQRAITEFHVSKT